MDELPPKWYSRLENGLIKNKLLILVALYVVIFFVWPVFQAPETLDGRLADYIAGPNY